MNVYTYEAANAPSSDLVAKWNQELKLFDRREPNPHGRTDEERRGWGFPAYMLPPPDCYEFVVAHFKREVITTRLDQPLGPEYRFSILVALMALFEWLRSKEGTRWLLHLYGIQMVPPHPGFAYFYEREQLKEPEYGLRIYEINRTSGRTAKSPIDYYGSEICVRLVKLLRQRRGSSDREMPKLTESMWAWISSAVRAWLQQVQPDRDWPTRNPNRISGYQWAKGVLRPGSQTDFVWNAIGQAESYTEGRLYRIQKPAYVERVEGGRIKRLEPDRVGVLWTDRKKVTAVPLDDLEKVQGTPPAEVAARYQCQSCSRVMCCTSGDIRDRLCMNCRGTQLERDERPSLFWCRYRECKRCPEQLRSTEDLINLVSRLNVSADRVRRD